MSDEELRALEAEVARSNDPLARARLGRALLRLGRSDEAFLVLAPARDHPEVRRELGRHPISAARPRTAAIDVPGARRWTVRWTRAMEADTIVATPFGLAVVERRHPTGMRVVDPETGSARWGRPLGRGAPRGVRLRAAGEALVASGAFGLVVLETWTGEERLALEGEFLDAWLVDERVLAWRKDEIVAVDLRSRELAWRAPLLPADPAGELLVTREHVFVPLDRVDSRATVVLDRETGRALGSIEGLVVHADEHGALVFQGAEMSSRPDPLGKPRWVEYARPLRASARHVLANALRESFVDLVLVARESGVQLASVAERGIEGEGAWLLLRDSVVAFTVESFEDENGWPTPGAWRFALHELASGSSRPLPAVGHVTQLDALPERIFGVVTGGSVFCLERS